MICIPIVASTLQEALGDMERAERMADILEVRLDVLPRQAWIPLVKRKNKPLIVTLRPERQGGHFREEEIVRIRLLEDVLGHDPDFVDLEWDTPPDLFGSLLKRKREKTRLIVSYHNFKETPHNLETIVGRVASRGGDVLKIVTQANRFFDNVRILEVVEKWTDKMIAFCMGPLGIPSRILTLRAGGVLTFGALDTGKESAPGQIPTADLKELYRVHQINRRTRLFGLIGNPVRHSLSPVIQNVAFQAAGIDAVYIPIQAPNLRDLIRGLGAIGVEGFSVTIPHKERIIPLLDDVDEEARRMGAVNTVYRRDGQWLGTNTDGYGAWKALETEAMDFEQKRWTILGAGGVARAVAYGIVVHGRPRSLVVLGRSRKRLERLVQDVSGMSPAPVAGAILAGADLGQILKETDIVINGTPVGMFPEVDQAPIPTRLLDSRHVVFDTIYNPIKTRLLKESGARGCRVVSGLQMFIHQGAAQFERWVGKTAPLSRMEQSARERLEK
jgi:3-dehydroquinate dehydratase/shikimate dehydrogenase